MSRSGHPPKWTPRTEPYLQSSFGKKEGRALQTWHRGCQWKAEFL